MKVLEKFFGEAKKKPEQAEQEPHYRFAEIKELEKPTIELVKQMKDRIDRGDYDALISDDTSGRIPTLIFRKILNERARIMRPEQSAQEREVKTVFIAGGPSPANNEALSETFENLKPSVKKKVLLITEYMSSGASVMRIAELLEKAEVPFDAASLLSRAGYGSYLREYSEIMMKFQLFIGFPLYAGIPGIWNNPRVSGVTKDEKGASTQPHPNLIPQLKNRNFGQWTQEKINQAREDADTLAKQVLKKVWG